MSEQRRVPLCQFPIPTSNAMTCALHAASELADRLRQVIANGDAPAVNWFELSALENLRVEAERAQQTVASIAAALDRQVAATLTRLNGES